MDFINFLKSKVFFKQIGFAILIVLLLIFSLKWWFGITTNHDQKIQVPNLEKMSLTEVEKVLSELDLNYILLDSTSYNPEYPKRSVIEQNPEAGEFVKEKRKIYLTINPSKYRDIPFPDLYGKTKRQAITHLLSLEFVIGEFSYIKDLGKDVVRGVKHKGKDIEVGDKLPKKSVIDLVLGDGNE